MKERRIVFIDGTKHFPCAFCGKVDELRPYGPNDEMICFDCAMKDEKTARRKMDELMANATVIIK